MPGAGGSRGRATLLAVPASQVALAAAGYLTLVAAGRATPVSSFPAITAFYLLLNTLGRGVFAAAELELTRVVTVARSLGDTGHTSAAVLLRRVVGLLVAALVLVGVTSPVLLDVLGHDPTVLAMLGIGVVTVAASYTLRGPLAARGRYREYSATYFAEALFCVTGGAALLATNEQRPLLWCAVFALSPVLAVVVVLPASLGPSVRRSLARALAAPRRETTGSRPAGLLWSAALFLASQGLWSLGAVIVTARADQPELAAGFAALSVLLRAPILVSPALQAILLPRVADEAVRGGRGLLAATLRRHAGLLCAGVALWLLVATMVLPPMTRFLFGLSTVPVAGVVAVLAVSPLLGVAAQVMQTQLVARRQHRGVALAWLAGLFVLLAVALFPFGAVDVVGAGAQLLGAAVTLATMAWIMRRNGRARAAAAAEFPADAAEEPARSRRD